MPYELQSPFAAATGALAGYVDATNKRKRQSVDDERQARLDAQAQADTQARLGLERSNQDATNAYRTDESNDRKTRLKIDEGNAGRADAAAAQALKDKQAADQKQKLLETFQGKGLHYPKNYATMKPEAKIGYLQVRLNEAQKAGDQKTVSNTKTEINRVATEAEQARRDAALEKQRDAQNKNQQQRIQISLDRPPAGSTLSPYQAWQEQVWEKTHNPDGTSKGTAAKPKAAKAPSVQDRRETDFSQGVSVIKAHPEHREEVVRRYAAKYQMPYDKADELFGDQ